MVMIISPRLEVERVEGHGGERRLVVHYGIDTPPDDPTIGKTLREDVTVSARDEHDAPIFPSDVTLRLSGQVELEDHGITQRMLTTDVHRVDLDVEQDWWRIDDGGRFEPIAEFVDHLEAKVTLSLGDRILASATTPTVTGSWGALGAD